MLPICSSPFGLQNKAVLVTGASSGIGRATALLCAQMGAVVVATGRNQVRLDSLLSSLPGDGHVSIAGDLTEPSFRGEIVERVPILNGCVFSAGIAALAPIRMVSEKHLRAMFSVNYDSPILLTQGLLAKKKIAHGASLVYVTARAEHNAPVATGVYSGTKAALTATVRTIAAEHAKHGVRANCVSPGYVDTPMLDGLQGVSSLQGKIELSELGRIEATDIAPGIVYLLSPASRWVSRSVLVVDGGLCIHIR